MADTLDRLKDALQARDKAREQALVLETQRTEEDGVGQQLESQLKKHSERLSVIDKAILRLRQVLAQQIEESRAVAAATETALRAIEVRRSTGDIAPGSYSSQEQVLRSRLEDAAARIEIREKAVQAESAADLDWLESVPAAHRAIESAQGQRELRVADWPGTSVPERVAMLWRESKKPHSRRPIITSAAIVAVLSLIVFGAILVSRAGDTKSIEDYLGEGEVLVPVLVEDMEGVRTLDFTLAYDPQLVTGISVIQSEVGRLSVMEYDVDSDGRLTVGIRDAMGLSGTGTILVVRFRANEQAEGPATLEFTQVEATDARTMLERPVEGQDGRIDTATLEVVAPVLRFP